MGYIQEYAPTNLYIESFAKGRWTFCRRDELTVFIDNKVSTFTTEDELPFELDILKC